MSLDPGRFAAVYAALWASHDLADHVVQTDAQAAAKSGQGLDGWRGMVGHLAGYGASQATALALLRAAGVRLPAARMAAGLAVSLGSHGFLDRRWPVVGILRSTGSARFAAPLVRVHHSVDGYGKPTRVDGVPRDVEASGPLPLHGPYLADQALHHVCVVLAAAVIAWRAA